MYLKYDKNTQGTDYCVGDLHGCIDRLYDFLAALDFNPKKDRLFSVGDLVDRGPDSEQILSLLEEDWFHPVLGNHEQMVIEAYEDVAGSAEDCLFQNGGAWWFGQPQSFQDEVAWAFRSLPVMIEVPVGDKTFGIIHSDVLGNSWTTTREELCYNNYSTKNYVLWNRARQMDEWVSVVEDVDCLLVGHTPVEHAAMLGNVVNLDTGAVFKGKFPEHEDGLTILNMNDFEFYKESDYV
jgi:serine/threonine protein phosphatase 1